MIIRSREFQISVNQSSFEDVKGLKALLPENYLDKKFIFLYNGEILSEADGTNLLFEDTSVVYACQKYDDVSIAKKPTVESLSDLKWNIKTYKERVNQLHLPHGQSLMKFLENQQKLSEFIKRIEGLGKDCFAMKLFKDPHLLSRYLNTENKDFIVKEHPCLIVAIKELNKYLSNEDGDLFSTIQQLIEQQSNEVEEVWEDEMLNDSADEMDVSPSNFQLPHENAAPQQITADFLSQALDNIVRAQSGNRNAALAPSQAQTAQPSTSDNNQANPAAQYIPPADLVTTLCEMGVSEEKARYTLTLTQGDLDTALAILFNN